MHRGPAKGTASCRRSIVSRSGRLPLLFIPSGERRVRLYWADTTIAFRAILETAQAHVTGIFAAIRSASPLLDDLCLRSRLLRFCAKMVIWIATFSAPVPLMAHGERADTTAFVHVTVVPMDSERLLHDQTVIARDGIIAAMGKSISVPSGARVIDGSGQYLVPGLTDMHSHSESRDDMAVFLAYGTTTILDMGGHGPSFANGFVPFMNAGKLPSPHIYTAFRVDGSANFGGLVVQTPQQARAAVELAQANGYNFIKVYNDLSADAFSALADEARQRGLPVIGHGVKAVRLQRQFELGQKLVAHLEEFFYAYFTGEGQAESDVPPEERRIADAVALAKRYGVTITADLATYHAIQHQIGHPERIAEALESPDAAFLSPFDRLNWQRSGYPAKSAQLAAKFRFLQKLALGFARSGVSLVSGTDTPSIPTLFPGPALHDNLEELASAGFTPFEALKTTTRAPGAFFAETKGGPKFGTISVGSRADMVLVSGNPLRSLATLRRPSGVMRYGRWYDRAALDLLLNNVGEAYRAASATRVARD